MQYRTLGSTGVQVSSLCLGAMMFGKWGNPDHDDSIGIIRTALGNFGGAGRRYREAEVTCLWFRLTSDWNYSGQFRQVKVDVQR